nr:vegetative cell wall protein gp1-like [Aegilops tauschii subsp. strangulata]
MSAALTAPCGGSLFAEPPCPVRLHARTPARRGPRGAIPARDGAAAPRGRPDPAPRRPPSSASAPPRASAPPPGPDSSAARPVAASLLRAPPPQPPSPSSPPSPAAAPISGEPRAGPIQIGTERLTSSSPRFP